MHPDLFTIGPFTLHTYGLFVATGFFVGLLVTLKIGKAEGFGSQQILDMGFLMILCAVIGSRLLYVLMNLSHYLRNPLEIFKVWQGGLVFSGGVILVIFGMFWYTRRHELSLLAIGDLWAPATALGQGIGRIGCFMAGCCYGAPTDLPWAVVFTHPNCLAPQGVALHPTQLYSALTGFIIFGILLAIRSHKAFQGQVFLWYLILHSTARLFMERVRGDDRFAILDTGLTITQLVALMILIAAVVALIILKSRRRKSG
jgi:phosphatidylglycerol:prolipoprotein diacylglycerol transferase